MTLARLGVAELVTLGYMNALEAPSSLQLKGGKTEVERAPSPVLLTAAVNRNRGDLSIALLDALIKAQIATVSPEQKLCEPAACVDQVLENYPDEWSMRPEAVCSIVEAVGARPDTASARYCSAVKKRSPGAPVYAEGGISPADRPNYAGLSPQGQPQQPAQQGRFSQPTVQSPWGANGGGDPFAMLPQMMRAMLPPPSSPQEAMLYDMLLQELEAQAQQLQGGAGVLMIPPGMIPPGMLPPGMFPPGMSPQGMVPPNASPRSSIPPAAQGVPYSVDLDEPDDIGTIPIDAGDAPQRRGGIQIESGSQGATGGTIELD
jgi:hypothetical protein